MLKPLVSGMFGNVDTVLGKVEEIERKCDVCYSRLARVETLDKVLRIDGEFVMVYGIPAEVCVDCGEEMLADDHIERVRAALQGDGQKTAKRVSLDAYDFADAKEITTTETEF